VPPAIASSEFTATSPEILSIVCADITLKPNQPTVRIHAPSARTESTTAGVPRSALPRVPAAPRAEQQHGHERDPPAIAWTTTEPAKSWNSAPNAPSSQAWTPKCRFQAMPSKNG